jgi:hypothetical protein
MAADFEISIAATQREGQPMTAWQRLRSALRLPSIRRERLIELHTGRVAALALALQLVFLVALAATLWLGQRVAAQASASAAVAFVDERLDELDATLRRLQSSLPEASGEPWTCSAELTGDLLRASLDSLLVQRFVLSTDDGLKGCGPQGAGSLGDLPPIKGSALALVSMRSIATELVLAKRLPDGRVLAAKLDPRALALPAGGRWYAAGDRGERITLHSSDQRALRLWGAAGTASSADPVLGLDKPSQRHVFSVSVEVDRAIFVNRVLGYWPLAATGAALTTLLIAWWVWRRTISRSRLVVRIERALQKRQFVPFVQPIVDMATGRCVGGEVLMRWAHPERGILPPGSSSTRPSARA